MSNSENHYWLIVNEISKGIYENLSDAKSTAVAAIKTETSVRIESLVGLAPSRIWIYDKGESDWVEQL